MMCDQEIAIIGAGLSGIGMAVHLTTKSPERSFTIFEARNAMGGTWDLFRYPGIRSDSDMHSLGYRFKPWTRAKAIADGPSIREYIRETAEEYRVADHIVYDRKLVSANWSGRDHCWQLVFETQSGRRFESTARFVIMCSGYYSYKAGYTPVFEGREDFDGTIVHPQHWPEDLDYQEKHVVVIGSGATAVTLVPEMAKTAAHVTMLQRSPTYIVSRPGKDRIANFLRAVMPDKWAYFLTRWKNILMGRFFYALARKRPKQFSKNVIDKVQKELGPDFDVATHFTPGYKPWDQRLCLVPDSDLFLALKTGKASVVTDHINRFEQKGIALKSGEFLPADIIITATGLQLEVMGGASFSIDGKPLHFDETFNYKGVMFSGVPNLGYISGYTNASWTLKADLVAEYLTRLINHMADADKTMAMPVQDDPDMEALPFLDFSSGYVQRSIDQLPKQGSAHPWCLKQDYIYDMKMLRRGHIEDGFLHFARLDDIARPAALRVRTH